MRSGSFVPASSDMMMDDGCHTKREKTLHFGGHADDIRRASVPRRTTLWRSKNARTLPLPPLRILARNFGLLRVARAARADPEAGRGPQEPKESREPRDRGACWWG